MSLLVVGLSHRSAPVELLERASLGREEAAKVLDDVHTGDHLAEAVVVATCNRIELYADAVTFHGGVDEARTLLAQHAGADLAELTDHLYVHYAERAVVHLFTVTAGLDSMVVGESQILGQVRDAFRLAQTSGATGRVLGELFQAALRVGKRAHAETGIDLAGRSLVTVGLSALAPGGVVGRRALVVGGGSMAGLAVATLARGGAAVVVANRTFDKAVRLAESSGGTALAMADVPAALADVDLVISCTGSTGVVLPYDLVAEAMATRGGRPLGVLDLALPRDVDPSARELPGLTLVDLAAISASDDVAAPAAGEVDAVRAIIADELAGFASAQRQARVAPTVVALRTMADDMVDAELARLRGRIPELDDRTEAEISSTVRRVVDKLLHAPTVRVKELADGPDGAAYESALRELFELDPSAVDAVRRPSVDIDHGEGALYNAGSGRFALDRQDGGEGKPSSSAAQRHHEGDAR